MPFAHRILIALRTLIEDDPEPPRPRRRRPNRNRQPSAVVLTFRDLFTSGGLNMILDELDVSRRPGRKASRNSFTRTNNATSLDASRPRVKSINQIVPFVSPMMPDPQEETVPLLLEETSETLPCRMLVPCPPPVYSVGLFSSLIFRKSHKPEDLTVPLDTDDEDKAVKTLRKALKWSIKKQNSAKFSLPLPKEEEHVALAVVQNAVNTVKEEQRKKKKRFLWLKIC